MVGIIIMGILLKKKIPTRLQVIPTRLEDNMKALQYDAIRSALEAQSKQAVNDNKPDLAHALDLAQALFKVQVYNEERQEA